MSFFKDFLQVCANTLTDALEEAKERQARGETPSGTRQRSRSTVAAGRPNKYDAILQEGRDPPPAPGLYQYRNEITGGVDYVGETNDLRRRTNQHRQQGHFGAEHTLEWRESVPSSTCAERREDEKRLIKKHKPKLNKTGGGNGRTPRGG